MAEMNQFISGWLHKKGGMEANKPWRRRWCVLADQALHYFKSEQDKVPTGSLYAEDMVGVSKNAEESAKDPKFGFVFEVYTSDRKFVFCANSQEEQDEWMGSIKRLLSRDERIDQGGWRGQMLEYSTVEVFFEKGIRVNGPLPSEVLSQLSQGATSKQKREDARGWYVDIFVSMHRVIEILTCHGWRLDQVYHTQGLLPAGPVACNMLIFSRAMTAGGIRMSGMDFTTETMDDDSLLVRGYTSATSVRRNTNITIGPDGAIVRDTPAKNIPPAVQEAN